MRSILLLSLVARCIETRVSQIWQFGLPLVSEIKITLIPGSQDVLVIFLFM